MTVTVAALPLIDSSFEWNLPVSNSETSTSLALALKATANKVLCTLEHLGLIFTAPLLPRTCVVGSPLIAHTGYKRASALDYL